ncbi:putative zinc-binding peptidase [Hyphomicrobium sp.]|uniref:zinc-binding metallopeptidase family protein n=1 Tax=Hyphomicrobium sp. TaxID=82 RepID=UPI0025C1E8A6|nr:putative zinc-binding peptidase [Hyphomicrobium sp.]MCC7252524.1 putative zinc-binding peptidase [Hyphomicrobium sp.]
MKLFSCSACGARVYFENDICLTCGHSVGFDADALTMAALELAPPGVGLFSKVGIGNGKDAASHVRYCENAAHAACNWLVPDDASSTLCKACACNRTIPNLSEEGRIEAWREVEQAKKRLAYSLLRFGLPLDGGPHKAPPLAFDFLAQGVTGHFNGVVTLDVIEADPVERERRRRLFDEPYRSLLGHLRHESGHYYWMLLVERGGAIEPFRELFGDERQDYQAALAAHYASGAPANWGESYVSAYATSHPWEDWAETWAHYMHMVDAVETAEATGMEPRAAGLLFGAAWPFKKYDVYRQESFDSLMERWVPLSLALNNLSRSLGHRDFYPFVISAGSRAKLAFVHGLVRAGVR